MYIKPSFQIVEVFLIILFCLKSFRTVVFKSFFFLLVILFYMVIFMKYFLFGFSKNNFQNFLKIQFLCLTLVEQLFRESLLRNFEKKNFQVVFNPIWSKPNHHILYPKPNFSFPLNQNFINDIYTNYKKKNYNKSLLGQ